VKNDEKTKIRERSYPLKITQENSYKLAWIIPFSLLPHNRNAFLKTFPSSRGCERKSGKAQHPERVSVVENCFLNSGIYITQNLDKSFLQSLGADYALKSTPVLYSRDEIRLDVDMSRHVLFTSFG